MENSFQLHLTIKTSPLKFRLLTLTILNLILTLTAWSQVTVTGTVRSADDNSPMPGVSVIEVGTTNGTVTQANGQFSIEVKDTRSTLQFQFIGCITKEEPLNGQNHVDVTLKTDCIRDWFDVQKISLYACSGVINNPTGGRLDIAFPAYFGRGTLTSGISYQTNFSKNEFINGDVTLKHFIFTCNFDIDATWFYRRIAFKNDFKSTVNAFEVNLNFRRFGIITGYSHLVFNTLEFNDRKNYNAPVIGFRTWTGGSLRLAISGKVSIYNGKQEYLVDILRESRHVDVFIKYYTLESFSEVSLGIGTTFGYLFKRQRESMPRH